MLKDGIIPPIWRAFPKDETGWILQDDSEPKRPLKKRLADILKLYDTPKRGFPQKYTNPKKGEYVSYRVYKRFCGNSRTDKNQNEIFQSAPDKIDSIISQLTFEEIKLEEIDTFIGSMRKRLIERILEGELASHPDYAKHERSSGTNSRNGKSSKTIKTEKGQIAIDIPRNREGTFQPQLVQKGQTRSGILDRQVIALYSKGMTT